MHIGPSGDDAFYKAEEESLGEETTPGIYSGREHGNHPPYDEQYAKNFSNLESLEDEGHWVEASERFEGED